MKVVILAGGLGTRISEYTNSIPKPMIEIGGKPILWHIMKIYSNFGFKEFIVALGYKGEIIKKYFMNYYTLNSDFTINLNDGEIDLINKTRLNWKIHLIDTGLNTLTGGRVKRLQSYLNDEPFLLTYGDAVSNVNIMQLVEFHKRSKRMATVTAVHPPARFGELQITEENLVKSFKEKPQTNQGWINGGFFVFESGIFNYLKDDSTILEKEPLENLASQGLLQAFYHQEFWQCMDTLRDKTYLDDIYRSGNVPWLQKK